MNRINPQLTTSPLPKSIFWRFFWFSTFVAAVTALAAIGVSRWMGRVLVYNIQDEMDTLFCEMLQTSWAAHLLQTSFCIRRPCN